MTDHHLALAPTGPFGPDGWTLPSLLDVVAQAERAGFAFVLLPDTLTPVGNGGAWPEAAALAGWLAAETQSIGLIVEMSPLRYEPYTIARRIASLDIQSGGRMGWHVPVADEAGVQESYSTARRIRGGDEAARRDEFIRIVHGLWRGWDADALVMDKSAGRFFDPEKMRRLDHDGRYYSVRGPLNVARSVQDAPVLSVTGYACAAMADLVIVPPHHPTAPAQGKTTFTLLPADAPDALDRLENVVLAVETPAQAEAAIASRAGRSLPPDTLRGRLDLDPGAVS